MYIDSLTLQAPDLPALHAFYGDRLGLPVTAYSTTELRLHIGASELIFTPGEGTYHFAFNIPENQFHPAYDWLTARVPPIADKSGQRAFHFADWQADSVYFFDPCGNIGELIARHTLSNASDAPFSARSLENISEIGIAVEDVPAYAASLREQIGVAPYRPGSSEFMPVGDEHGLCILVKPGRIWYPDSGKAAVSAPIRIVIRGQQRPVIHGV